MTVASEESRSGPYIGNGVTTVFPYDFRIIDEAHIQVVRTETNADTVLTLGADYTVSGVGNVGGGSITMIVAPTASQTITLLRNVPFTQETDLENQGAYFAETIEASFDLSVMRDQQLSERLSRAVVMPASTDPGDISEFVTAIDNAAANAQIAIAARDAANAAASALGNQVHQYDTRALAIAAAIPSGVGLVRLLGRAASADQGGGLYKKLGVAPGVARSWHWQNTASASWWELKEYRVNPRMFGAVGNGVVDDRSAMQDAIDFIAAMAPGGAVEGVPGDIYRVVINTGVTDKGLVLKSNVVLLLNGSTINFECDGQVYGLRPMNHTRIYGPGTLKTTVSTGHENPFGQNQAIFHAPISLGDAYGAGGTVGAVSQFLNVTDIIIDSVTIDSARNDGGATMVCGYGGINNITIRNNTFPDNSTAAIAIGFDWSFVGLLSSADLAGNKTRYNAGTAYSVHPHDITIENNKIGRLTMPLYTSPGLYGTHGVRLSGVYNCRVVGNDIDETNYAGIFVTGGDLSFEYAPGVERFQAMKNIVVEGNCVRQCNTYYGIYYEAYPDNIYVATTNPADPQYPYAPFYYHDGYQANTRIVGNILIARGGGYLGEGIYVQFSRGCHVSDNIVQGFKTGIRAGKGAADAVIERNSVSLAAQSGILVSDSASPIPVGILVHKNRVLRNCTDGGTTGNICVDYANRSMVSNNHVGSPDEDSSSVGIKVTENGFFSSVLHNRVEKTKAGGTAFVLSNATVIDAIWEVHGNVYDGTDTFMSGLPIIPYRREYSTAGILMTHASARATALGGGTPGYYPTIGSWGVGSTLTILDAGSGNPPMSKCVNAGPPSSTTWRPFANLV